MDEEIGNINEHIESLQEKLSLVDQQIKETRIVKLLHWSLMFRIFLLQ